MKTKIRRLLLTLFLVLSASVAAGPFATAMTDPNFAGTASFDPAQNQHLDRSLIVYGGRLYFDNKNDSTFSYPRKDGQGSCKDNNGDHQERISDLKNDNTSATLYTYVKDPQNGACNETKTTVNLAHKERSYMPLAYGAAKATIVTSDYSKTFTSPQDNGKYLEQNGNQCKDILDVQVPPVAGSATVSITPSTSGTRTGYESWASPRFPTPRATTTDGGNGCTNFAPRSFQVSAVFLDPAFQKWVQQLPEGAGVISGADFGGSGGGGAWGSGGGSGSSGGGNASADPSCGGGALDWVLCPVITLMKEAIKAVDSFVMGQLQIPADKIFASDSGYYKAWNAFRILATALIVISGLVIIIAQTAGFEALDAYSIKKALPRLIAAVIGISLSWPLMKFFVDFSNVLGNDIKQIILAPFSGLSNDVGITANILSFTALVGGGFILGAMGLLALVGSALVALFWGAIVLIIRQVLVIVLIVFAPVAIACAILPNTQKFWNLWRENFIGILMAFPLIAGFIAASQAFAKVAYNGGTTQNIIGIIAYFAPYFLIAQVFKLAAGALSTITGGFAQRRTGSLNQRLAAFRGRKAKENFELMQTNRRFNPNRGGFLGKVSRKTNAVLGNVSSPTASGAIYGGRALRKMGFKNATMGQGVLNQIDESKFQHTAKMAEYLNQKGFNDRALRAIMSMDTLDAKSLNETVAKLQTSENPNERLAAQQISSMATTLITDAYKNPEMGRADIGAAAGLALSQQGFATPDDVAMVGNRVSKSSPGLASTFVTQAQLASQRAGRQDFKPGYSIRLGPGGTYEATTALPSSKQDDAQRSRALKGNVDRIRGIGTYELTQSKPATLDALREGFIEILRAPAGKEMKYVDADGVTKKYSITEADKTKVIDMLASIKAPNSGANAEHLEKVNKIMEEAAGPDRTGIDETLMKRFDAVSNYGLARDVVDPKVLEQQGVIRGGEDPGGPPH